MGYWDVKPYEDIIGKTSGQGFTNMLQDYMDIYSGKKSPTELPMYKTFANDLETMFSKASPDIMKEAVARGIRGGTLGNILTSGHNDLIDKSVKAIYDMYNQAPKAIGGAYAGSAQLGENEVDRTLKFFEAYKNRHLQGQEAKMQGITSGITSALSRGGGGKSAGCGFIFTQGEGILTNSVRRYRDSHYGHDGDVANGYRWMASWLVPLMENSKLLTWIVRKIMTQPLTQYALWDCGENRYGWIFQPFKVWTVIWNLIGKIRRI